MHRLRRQVAWHASNAAVRFRRCCHAKARARSPDRTHCAARLPFALPAPSLCRISPPFPMSARLNAATSPDAVEHSTPSVILLWLTVTRLRILR